MQAARPRIAIIGGGWSGLACAEALAQVGLGPQVDVLEAAPQFGGRARGLLWTSPGANGAPLEAPIDAGQHLLIAAYTETLALLRRAEALDRSRWRFDWLSWQSHNDTGMQTWWEILPKLLLRLPALRARPNSDESVEAWLQRCGTGPSLSQHLLRPLAESALNTDWTEASAMAFYTVLRDATRGGPLSLRGLQPTRNLSLDGLDPIVSHLRRLGVTLLPRTRVRSLQACANGGFELVGTTLGHTRPHAQVVPYAQVVLALPSTDSSRLLGMELPAAEPEVRAIGTLFLHLPPDQPPLSCGQIHCLSGKDPHRSPVIGLARPSGPWGQVVSLVVSALPPDRDRQDEAQEQAWSAARLWLGQRASLRARWIVDRQATWAATPSAISAQPTSEACRPLRTGLWQCGDDLVSGYPATIESAVRSGRAGAEAVARTLRRPSLND